MTITRETRNLGMIEDAVANVGTAITVAEHLHSALGPFLPDEDGYPHQGEVLMALANVRDAHNKLEEAMGL